jgi:hypothetical protein
MLILNKQDDFKGIDDFKNYINDVRVSEVKDRL